VIARYQLVYLHRSGRLWLAMAVLLLLLGGSLVVSLVRQQARAAEVAVAAEHERERWLSQGTKNPHLAAHWGLYAFRPRSLGGAVEPGVDAYVGSTIWIEAHKENAAQFREADERQELSSLGDLTPAFVLTVLLPLILLLLCHDALAGERESGTIRTVLALGVDARRLLLGKALGTAAALLLVTLPTLIAGLSCVAWLGHLEGNAQSLSALLRMMMAYTLYAVAFGAVGLLVSVLSQSRRMALACGVGIWILLCLLGPRVASRLASWAYPAPNRADYNARLDDALEHGLDGKSSPELRRREAESEVPAGHQSQGYVLEAEEQHGYKVFDAFSSTLDQLYSQQAELLSGLSLVCPPLAVRAIAMDQAGTDWRHVYHFDQEVEGYRREMVQTMNRAMMEHSGEPGQLRADERLWKTLPPFVFHDPGPLGGALPWLALVFWAVLPLALLSKVPVRP
jgi:ABC-2 type transport system permease protein